MLLTINRRNLLRSLKFLFFHIIFFLIYIAFDSYGQVIVLSIGFPIFFLFFLISLWSQKYPIISVYFFFFVFLVFYNAGHFLNIILGAPINSIARGFFPLDVVSKAGFFCFSFLSFLHIFFLLSSPSGKVVLCEPNLCIQTKAKANAILIAGSTLLGISIIPYVWSIWNIILIVRTYGYAHLWYIRLYLSESIIPTEISALTSFLTPALLMIYIGSKKSSTQKLMISLLIMNFVLFSLAGLRSKAVLPLFSLLIAYYHFNRNICIKNSKKIFLCVCIFFVFYIPLTATMRSNNEYSDLPYFSSNFSLSATIGKVLDETGISFIGVPYSIQNIPSNKSYWLGRSYFLPFLESLPFLNAKRLFSLNIINSLPFIWFNKSFDPEKFERGGGWGFSVIAEAYANFGFLALLLIPPLLAFALRKLDNSIFSRKVSFLSTFTILSIPDILFLSRSSIDVSIRPLMIYTVIPILYSYLIYAGFPKKQNSNTKNSLLKSPDKFS